MVEEKIGSVETILVFVGSCGLVEKQFELDIGSLLTIECVVANMIGLGG